MKSRGFEVVESAFRTAPDAEIILPTRADARSAGYDFHSPITITLKPGQKTILFTDVKAYMLDYELLELYIRSSLAIKEGLMLSNNVGIVDASYYENPANNGNIGIPLVNTSARDVTISVGQRVAQGIFKDYRIIDDDKYTDNERAGGFGSSGK
jgi:dUTP pyrophosphatase